MQTALTDLPREGDGIADEELLDIALVKLAYRLMGFIRHSGRTQSVRRSEPRRRSGGVATISFDLPACAPTRPLRARSQTVSNFSE